MYIFPDTKARRFSSPAVQKAEKNDGGQARERSSKSRRKLRSEEEQSKVVEYKKAMMEYKKQMTTLRKEVQQEVRAALAIST